jgi:hypothetical protein
MSSELDPTQSWERIALELRACKESQRQAWGDVDNATLGRYLAGEASQNEQAEVEQALQDLPELRKLTDIVRDVLSDVVPAFDEELAPVEAASAAPAVLPFARAVPGRGGRFVSFLRRQSSLIAAACLLLTFSVAMPRPGYLSAPRPEPSLTHALASARPVPVSAEPDGVLPEPRLVARAKKVLLVKDELREEHLALVKTEPTAANVPVTPQQTAELNRQVVLWARRGELTRAVPPLRQAHQAYQRRFGANHPSTQKTARYLANFYAAALAPDPSPSTLAFAPAVVMKKIMPPAAPTPQPAPQPVPGATSQDAYFLQTASTLGMQIVNRSTQEVQTAVVPVMVQALKAAVEPKERRHLVRALAALGPAARTAIPALTDRLEHSKDPLEVQEILTTLTRMGPAARTALPTLVALSSRCQAAGHARGHSSKRSPVVRSPISAPPPPPPARFTATEEKLVRKAMASLDGPDGRTGIDDQAGCLSVATVRRGTKALRELAGKTRIEVRFETVACCDPALKDRAKEHRKEVQLARGARTVHVLFDPQGALVQVQVGAALQREGLTPEKLRKGLEDCLRHHPADKGLADSIKFVTGLAVQGK